MGNGLTISDLAECGQALEADARHWDHRIDEDHWEQPGNLFRLMTEGATRAAVREYGSRDAWRQ